MQLPWLYVCLRLPPWYRYVQKATTQLVSSTSVHSHAALCLSQKPGTCGTYDVFAVGHHMPILLPATVCAHPRERAVCRV